MVSVSLPLMPACNTYHLTWVSLTLAWGISSRLPSNAQPLLLTLDEGYLLTAAVPDLQRGIAPLEVSIHFLMCVMKSALHDIKA